MLPGLRLRQTRERLGLTYRDVERASYELASRRGRPEFILHISRLADIENRGVVPGLHKLYTLATLYRLNPLELFRWYDVGRAGRGRACGARDGRGYTLERAGIRSSSSISRRARRLEQKSSLR